MIDERRHPAITQIMLRISIFAHMLIVGKIHAGPTLVRSEPAPAKVNLSSPYGGALLKIRVFCVCRDVRRELLSAGTFVIGSDDRLPLLDNSPLKAKGKWSRWVTANWTLDIARFSSQGLNKLMPHRFCDSYILITISKLIRY